MDSIKILFSIIGTTLEVFLGIIYFYLIRIYFSLEIVGLYGTIIAFFTALACILDLGFSIAHLKFFSESKDSIEQAFCNGALLFYKLLQFIAFSTINLCLIPILPLYPGDVGVVYVLFLATTFSFTQFFFQPLFLGKKQVIKYSLSVTIAGLTRVIFLIILTRVIISDIWLLSYILLISNIVYIFVNIYFARHIKIKIPQKSFIKKYLKYAFPFFITTSLIVVVANIDILFLSAWFPVEDVGNYYSAKKFYVYIFIFIMGISNILITTFSKNLNTEEKEKNIAMIQETHRILNLITVPIVMIIILYLTDFMVIIFGENYRLMGIVLTILAITLIPLSLNIANNSQLQALGEVKLLAKITILENIIALILMIFLIFPVFLNLGTIGGGLAIVIASFFIQLISRPILYKKYSLGFYFGSFRNIIIMVGIIYLQLIFNSLFTYPLYFIPVLILIDIFCYFIINYLLKGITMDDIKLAISIINYKNIKSTVFSELDNKS